MLNKVKKISVNLQIPVVLNRINYVNKYTLSIILKLILILY